jgi:hypothetical protein
VLWAASHTVGGFLEAVHALATHAVSSGRRTRETGRARVVVVVAVAVAVAVAVVVVVEWTWEGGGEEDDSVGAVSLATSAFGAKQTPDRSSPSNASCVPFETIYPSMSDST